MRAEKAVLLLAEEIEKAGGEPLMVRADVSIADDVKSLVQKTIECFGRIDIPVNDAAILIPSRFIESTEENWDRTIAVNLKSLYLCWRAVAPIMLKQDKGKIVNVSSLSGLSERSALPNADYFAQGRLLGLTRSLAVNSEPTIHVNAVCPDLKKTEMITNMLREAMKLRMEETPSRDWVNRRTQPTPPLSKVRRIRFHDR